MERDHVRRHPITLLQRATWPKRTQSSEGTSWIARHGLSLILLVILIGFSLAKPSSFATWNNYRSILNNDAVDFAPSKVSLPLWQYCSPSSLEQSSGSSMGWSSSS